MSLIPRLRLRRRQSPPVFWLTYALSVIFIFHGLIVSYSNSSYLEKFTSPEMVGLLYTIGSALSVLLFLFITKVLRRIGNVQMVLWLSAFELLSLVLMGLAFDPATTIIAFVLFILINPLIYLSIDIFAESLIGEDEGATGARRGLTLSLMSLASTAGPFSVALLVGADDSKLYQTYYLAATVLLIFMAFISTHFHAFADPDYHDVKLLEALRSFWRKPNQRYVFLAHFILQIFFAWTIIYIPLYLVSELGLGWGAVGSIIGVSLLAYVIFEYPVGLIADRYIGEKEMMALGFFILAVSVSWISFMTSATVIAWMVLMFINRIGASLVEATTEVYFFKQIGGTDAKVMGFFRLTRPLALMVGSLLGSVALLYLPFNLIFIVLALLMVVGIGFTLALEDTR